MTYSTRPAPPVPGGVVGLVGVAAEPSVPRLDTSLGVVTYPVQGRTAGEVLASMRAGAPSSGGTTYFGMTESAIDVRFRAVETAGGCRLSDVEVDLDVTMTLPDWEPDGPTAYAVRRDWARFSSALRRHEDGHHARAVAGAEAVADALAEVVRPTCAEADAEGRRRARAAQDRTAAEQAHFDDQTDHGRTEGAAWPLTR